MIHRDLIQEFLNSTLIIDCHKSRWAVIKEILNELSELGVRWYNGAPANLPGSCEPLRRYLAYPEKMIYANAKPVLQKYLVSSDIYRGGLKTCTANEFLKYIHDNKSTQHPIPLDLSSVFA